MNLPGGNVLIFVFLLSGCAGLGLQSSIPTASVHPPFCDHTFPADKAGVLVDLKDRFIVRNDAQLGNQLLKDQLRGFSCIAPAAFRALFVHSNQGSVASPDVSCLAISILEKSNTNPFYEEWVACVPDSGLQYLIDFNNILTQNKRILPHLRIQHSAKSTSNLEKCLSGRLYGTFPISDYEEFMWESISFEPDHNGEILEEFPIIHEM